MPEVHEVPERAVNKKNASSKAVEFINTGLAPQVVHDIDNVARTIEPGASMKIEMHAGVADKLLRASDRNSPLQTGDRAKQFLERQRFEKEMHEKQEKMKADMEADANKNREELHTRHTKSRDQEEPESTKPPKK